MAGRPKRREKLAAAGQLEWRHGEGCECKRCTGLRGAVDGRPFPVGNTASERHGSYVSEARLAADPRTLELEAAIRESAPWIAETDAVSVKLLAITLRRVERAVAAIEAADALTQNPLGPYITKERGALGQLRNDLRLWVGQAARLAAALGLDPLSRSRLGVNVARIQESPVARMQREARELEAAS